jgi:tetratricopeptide (TPR) repeat protein
MSTGRLTMGIVGSALIGAMTMSGCSLMDRETQDKLWSESTFTPTAVGTATGAVIGGGIGAIIGAQSGNPVGGMAIGASAGMATGAAIGYNLEDSERKVVELEEREQREDERFESNRRRIEAIKQNKDRMAAAERDARAKFSQNTTSVEKASGGYDKRLAAKQSASTPNSLEREWIVPRSSDLARSGGSAARTQARVRGAATTTVTPGISAALAQPQPELPAASDLPFAVGAQTNTAAKVSATADSPAITSSGLPAAKTDSGLPLAAVNLSPSESSAEEIPAESLSDDLEIDESVEEVASESDSAGAEVSSASDDASKTAAPVKTASKKETEAGSEAGVGEKIKKVEEAVSVSETKDAALESKGKTTALAKADTGKQNVFAKSEMTPAAALSTNGEGGNDCQRADEEALRAKNSASEADQLFYFRRAIRLCPNEPRHHIQIGQVYAAIGRSEDAEGEFKKALELDPKSDDAKRQLSLIDDSKQKY